MKTIAVDVEAIEAAARFPGFESAIESGGRFRDGLHRTEPGCPVLAAVEAGEIAVSRHSAYCALLDELAEGGGGSGPRHGGASGRGGSTRGGSGQRG